MTVKGCEETRDETEYQECGSTHIGGIVTTEERQGIRLIWVLRSVVGLRTHDDATIGEDASLVRQGKYRWRRERLHKRNRRTNPLSSTVDEQGIDASITSSDERRFERHFIDHLQRLDTSLMIVGINLIVCQLTPIGKLQNLGLAFRFRHQLELSLVGRQSGERLCARRRGMNEQRSSKPVIQLAAVVRMIPDQMIC